MTDKIFDLQDNIIIVTDLHTIKYANRAFFRFFSEYSTIDDFNKNVSDISSLFEQVEQYGFIYKNMSSKDWNPKKFEWYEYVIFSANKICKVLIKDAIFNIKISIYNDNDYILTLSDITELVTFKNDLLSELQQKNIELEQKNSSLESTLQDKLEELQKLNKELEKILDEKVHENTTKDNLLTQQSKLEIMSQMITMLSHQWKQPLTAISAYMQGMKFKNDKNALTSDYIDEATADIVRLTKSLAETINDFQNFFKPDEKKEQVKLFDMIDKAHKLLEYTFIQNSIDFVYESKFDITLNIFPSKFLQVLLDIFQNSKDVLVSRMVNNPRLLVHVGIDHGSALILIKDNGGGIDEKIINKVFEPYFSTKNDHKRGLGLYMAHMIITQNLHGSIKAYNDNDGAVIAIKLPMVVEDKKSSHTVKVSTDEFDDLFEGYNDGIENIQISAKISLLDLFVILEFFIWYEAFLKQTNKLNHFRASLSNIINYLRVYDNPAKLDLLEQHREELFNLLGSIGNDLKILFYSIVEDREIYNLDKSLVSSFHQLFVILHRKDKATHIEFFN